MGKKTIGRALSSQPLLCAAALIGALLFLYAVSLTWLEIPGTLKGGIRELQFSSGAICYILASFLVITACRPAWLNALIPLDKYYLAHKVLGIACVIFAVLHFYAKDLGRTLLPLFFDFAAPAASGPRGAGGYSLRSFAEDSAYYLTLLSLGLIIITFIERLPYRLWQRLHRLFPAIYLMIVLHAAVLTEKYQYPSLLSIICLILTVIALPCAVKSMLGKGGSAQQAPAQILEGASDAQDRYLCLKLKAPARLCRPGAFALLKLGRDNPHPYTIADASVAEDGAELTLYIRRGSFFAEKLSTLKAGDLLTIEGPYGGCDFVLPKTDDDAVLWVFQGSGLAQLPSALRQLQKIQNKGQILILCLVKNRDDAILKACWERLEQAKAEHKLTLIIHESQQLGRFGTAEVQKLFAKHSISGAACCGGTALKEHIRSAFMQDGGTRDRFVSEYTAWRGFKPWH